MRENRTIRLYILFVMLIIALPGCVGVRIQAPELKILKASQYRYCQEEEGLRIALDPFMEEDRLKMYFGGDLLAFGILPVLVVAENEKADFGYLIEEKKFAVKMEEGYRFEGKDPYKKDPLVKEKILWGGGLAGVLLVTPTIFVLPLALIPAFLIDQKIAEINYINMNIKNRSFVDRTIYPGETQSGFIYFRVPGREPVSHIKSINLAVKELRSEKEQQFIFDFNK